MATTARNKKRTVKSNRSEEKKVVKTVTVDFSDVGEGYGRVKDGEYMTKVKKVEKRESDSGNDYLQFTLEITDKGKNKGKLLRHICSLQPQALFNLRNTIEALGMEVPRSKLKLTLAEYIGKTLGVIVENEVYQGRKQSRVVEVYNPEDREDEEDEDDDGDSDDGDDDEGDEEEEEDEEEDEDSDDDDESDDSDDDDEEDGDEDDEEEEPEPEPPPKKTKKKTTSKKSKDEDI